MAYAELPDLKARAGVLASAWTAVSTPGDAELEIFLRSVSGQIDAILQQAGAAVPTEDAVTVGALNPIVADGALLLAIDATWPGDTGQAAVAALKSEVMARYSTAYTELCDGTSPIIKGLVDSAGQDAKASSLWTDEPQSMLIGSQGWNEEIQKGITIGPGITPGFYRGQPL